MPHQYTVPLKKLIKDLNLQILYYPKTEEEILVSHAELMRPGLAFTGFFQGFVPARINMIGRTELAYLETLPPTCCGRAWRASFPAAPRPSSSLRISPSAPSFWSWRKSIASR